MDDGKGGINPFWKRMEGRRKKEKVEAINRDSEVPRTLIRNGGLSRFITLDVKRKRFSLFCFH